MAVSTFLAVRIIRVGLEVRGWASFAAICGVAGFGLSTGALALARSVAALELRPPWGLLPRVLLAALLTALLSPLLRLGLRRLDAALGEQASELGR
jgi:hypothetical protein